MDFANTSKYLRKAYNLTQEELAEFLGVSKSCIAMIETEKKQPTAHTLTCYADYFNCSTDFLLGRTGDKEKPIIPEVLKTDESELLNEYRILPDDLKTRAKSYVKKLSNVAKETV